MISNPSQVSRHCGLFPQLQIFSRLREYYSVHCLAASSQLVTLAREDGGICAHYEVCVRGNVGLNTGKFCIANWIGVHANVQNDGCSSSEG